MGEFTVRDVGVAEERSIQEIEQELLDKHEEKFNNEAPNEGVDEGVKLNIEGEKEEVITPELKDEDVLSYIKGRYNKEINSVDELFKERESNEELPSDVSAFLKYKKETGRGIDDFIRLNKDFDKLTPEKLLAEYYSATESDLDSEDIDYMIEDRFSYDPDFDDEKDIKKKEIAKKKELAKAKKFFEDQKEQYKTPAESKGGLVSDDEKETYDAYKKYVQDSNTMQQEGLKKAEYFQKKTEEIFNSEFKGFEFNVGEKDIKFLPGDPSELKKSQSDLTNYISKYLDKDGLVSDAVGYHRSLSVAMNPEKFAKFFYEQGKAEALLDTAKQTKNIDMDMRSSHQSISTSGVKVKSVDGDSGGGLKFKSLK
jgi:hypothetical protein